MSADIANLIVMGLGIYAGIGLIVGVIYMFGGVGKIDPAAKGKGMTFRARLIILPGIVGLWPLMLFKLLRQKEPPVS